MSRAEVLLLWPTTVIHRLVPIAMDPMPPRAAAGRPLAEALPPADLDALRTAVDMAATALRASPSTRARLESTDVERWEQGHCTVPVYCPEPWHGLFCLGAETSGSGADPSEVLVLDPRHGSLTAPCPGFPFGRSLRIPLLPRTLLMMPGWLPWSVVPLRPGCEVLIARLSPG